APRPGSPPPRPPPSPLNLHPRRSLSHSPLLVTFDPGPPASALRRPEDARPRPRPAARLVPARISPTPGTRPRQAVRRHQTPTGAEVRSRRLLRDVIERPFRGGPGAVESAIRYLASLFPRQLFEDALPPLVLKHQLYSLVRDRTAVDRQLSRLKDEGLIRLFQLGFDSDVFGVAFTQDYTVLQAVAGKEYAGMVRRFLETAFASCPELSYDNGRMLKDFGFRDPDITQLVNAGVLTVRDAGSWWLAVPAAGRFVKCFIKGRKAVLGMIQKAKYKEILLSDLQSRRAPSAVKLGLPYHIHDLIGAQLVDCIPSTSGTLLRLANS
uniref:Serine/threonine kinase 19 n=1 Tax=Chelonoidis abingdonii TaxID=106734 RepID=A0A8C0JEW3_CHEAB